MRPQRLTPLVLELSSWAGARGADLESTVCSDWLLLLERHRSLRRGFLPAKHKGVEHGLEGSMVLSLPFVTCLCH